jgi:hypothetical protein
MSDHHQVVSIIATAICEARKDQPDSGMDQTSREVTIEPLVLCFCRQPKCREAACPGDILRGRTGAAYY